MFLCCGLQAPAPPHLQTYLSKYYIIQTDLRPDQVKEAVIRMNKMAEEYHQRTRAFSGDIRQRLPFYLFKDAEEYYEAGGIPGSAGVFDGQRLMAIAGQKTNAGTWHTVQHEGFHQFAHAVIAGHLPTWVDEGLAEYFGESLFTGDGFVSGVIPSWRLRRVQEEMKTGRFKTIQEMMLTSQEKWNSALSVINYDQAWSMVHFLAHGENGRYQEAFVSFMRLLSRGMQWPMAWRQTFGEASGFEQRWRDYWLKLPNDPTRDLYEQAAVATLNSFLARAQIQKQQFASIDDFLSAAEAERIKTPDTMEDWLPPQMAHDAARAARNMNLALSLERPARSDPQISAELGDGTRINGFYSIRSGRITRVGIDLDDTAKVIKEAREMIADGKKQQARTLLQNALRAHPKSVAAPKARDLLMQTR